MFVASLVREHSRLFEITFQSKNDAINIKRSLGQRNHVSFT